MRFPPQHTTTDKGHGRIERRDIWISTELNDYLDFPHVQQVFCIKRTTTDLAGNLLRGRKSTEELALGITSLSETQASPEQLLSLVRGEWEIENRLHYVRDMTCELPYKLLPSRCTAQTTDLGDSQTRPYHQYGHV